MGRAEKVTAPTVAASVARRAAATGKVQLSAQQRRAVESICQSGRQVDVLVGPAGAGKTTTMRALRTAWIAERGRGSVVGLAPSAAASQALADDLGVACENTAKWLHEYDHGRTELRRGQLVIVDEATLADTVTLDRLTGIAAGAGAKVLLVGDPHQLQSVDAGGAFALLVDRRADAPELIEIHRFTNEWEKDASLALSRGDVQAISAYGRHKRIREGVTDEMVDAAYVAWRADCAAGRASILVTESARDVRALNERARAERLLLDGAVDQHEVDLIDGCRASVGDIVITRQNDRRIRTMRGGWVKNGDRWKVTDIRRDGAVVVKRMGPGRGGRTVLPAEYVAEHVDLGYAVTAHRAQGITVDTAHVVVTPSTTRENLYVSMTRGRDSNIAYVALDQPDDSHSTPEADDVTARTVLYGVLQHSGADLSATQTIEAEYELHGGIDRLAAELETIAAEAQHERFVDLLSRSGLTAEQHAAVVESTAFGPLTAALRRAEAYHHDLERLVPRVVGRHGLDDADDIAAVLRYRVDQVASTPPRGCRLRPRLIAGLIPEPLGAMSAEDRQAIDERKELIESRARALAEDAVASHAGLDSATRAAPRRRGRDAAWLDAATTVAAYRDRYKITSDLPVGGGAKNDAQRAERQRALAALRAARLGGRSRARHAVSRRWRPEPFRLHRWPCGVVLHRDARCTPARHRRRHGVSRKSQPSGGTHVVHARVAGPHRRRGDAPLLAAQRAVEPARASSQYGTAHVPHGHRARGTRGSPADVDARPRRGHRSRCPRLAELGGARSRMGCAQGRMPSPGCRPSQDLRRCAPRPRALVTRSRCPLRRIVTCLMISRSSETTSLPFRGPR